MDRYLDAIIHHMRQCSSEIGPIPVSTVYLGGGTPSLMGPARIARLLAVVSHLFSIESNAEITLEANPESASQELFSILAPLGLNRVSLGAQSFNGQELIQIGRVHDTRQTLQAIENARLAGIDNISIDLIYALPSQTRSSWTSTLRQAVACGVDHISAYGLSYEEGTLLYKLRQDGKVTPLLDETYVDMYDELCDTFEQHGYIQYEISNWSRPGKQSRHNTIYWDRDDYLAFGVSAHGLFRGVRYGWIPNVAEYTRFFEPNHREKRTTWLDREILGELIDLTPQEHASDAIIFGLRKMNGIHKIEFMNRFGYLPSDRWGKEIQRLVDRGLLEQDETRLRLTRKAIMISNSVFEHFIG